MNGLRGTMANGPDASKHLHHGDSACPYVSRANLGSFASAKLTISARDQLWTSAALAVDGLPVRLRRFRKSHHLIPASPGARSGDCSRQPRIMPTCVGLLRAYQTIVSESFSENGKVETEMSLLEGIIDSL